MDRKIDTRHTPPDKPRMFSGHHSPTTLRLLAPLSSTTGKVQALGMGIIAIMILLALFAPLIATYDPRANVCEPFDAPSAAHWLGCNDFGQDLLTQLLYGARVSLFVGILVAFCATLIATLLALLAGYHASREDTPGSSAANVWIDRVIMRLVDVTLALPFLPLVIVLGVYFGASIQTQILVITLVMWAQPVRELRSQILSIRAATFVEASRAMGAQSRFVSARHILPELAPLIVPQFVRIAHNAILVEAALSFLGLGDPLQNSWGSMLFHANARSAFLTGTWVWWILPPGFAIALTVVAFAFIGYGFDASLSARDNHKPIRPGRRPRGEQSPETSAYLDVRDLSVDYPTDGARVRAVRHVSLSLNKGEVLGLVGESGSGKTTIGLAILQMLRQPADITAGSIHFEGEDLLQKTPADMRRIRADKITLIPQSAMNALNPVMSIREQLAERLRLDASLPRDQIEQTAKSWMQKVGLKAGHLNAYPHELSGGMRQRAVIAIALSNRPELVIADEPTTGLDVLVQADIMRLLLGLRAKMGLTILFVTHNLKLIARHCDRLAVLHEGAIIETGPPHRLSTAPSDPHTRALFDNLPSLDGKRRWSDMRAWERTSDKTDPVLVMEKVSKSFAGSHGFLFGYSSRSSQTKAVKDVSLSLSAGEALGLVGGSGAGKSTIARLIVGATRPDAGSINLMGKSWQSATDTEANALHQQVHLVYQDPYQSLNNRLSIADLIAEPLLIHLGGKWQEHREQITRALAQVRLPHDDAFLARLPVSLSGGQRQRVAFARAIVTNPALIIADEPTSMLDQSIRMEVMEVMESLRADVGTAFLFITHDIALARHFCDRLIVMKDGKIVEQAPTEDVITSPQHAYTRSLITAV